MGFSLQRGKETKTRARLRWTAVVLLFKLSFLCCTQSNSSDKAETSKTHCLPNREPSSKAKFNPPTIPFHIDLVQSESAETIEISL
jgi:hypothetical protein